jgi:hypothetical protein
MRRTLALAIAAIIAFGGFGATVAESYVANRVVGNTGGCPQLTRFNLSSPGAISRRWSTSIPSSIVTSTGSGSSASQAEIENSILRSYAAWSATPGAALRPMHFAPLQSTSTQNACTNDGVNSICFNQSDSAFTGGVLAFARVFVAISGPSVGQIVDADIQFRTPDAQNFRFATPAALDVGLFDLESVLTHEIGHTLGSSHSGIWRAMMYPFAPAAGTFLGQRPTPENPAAQLAEDDHALMRVLYPDPLDMDFNGAIRGRIVPANPIALAGLPEPSPGRPVTGIFGAHVVAVDADTGAAIAGTIAGWSCNDADLPTRFDGSYEILGLPVGRRYKVFVEPLDGPARASSDPQFNHFSIFTSTTQLCRSGTNNSCTLPSPNTSFTTRIRP